MISSDETVENAWMRSHAQCECRRASHHHQGRCNQDLVWENRGRKIRWGAWEARPMSYRTTAGWEAVNHCEILCWHCYDQIVGITATVELHKEDRVYSWVAR
jgi:hypothetical protein